MVDRSPVRFGVVVSVMALGAILSSSPLVAVSVPEPEARQSLLDDACLRNLCFIDKKLGWAVGDRGVIVHTNDGGKHWLLQSSGVGCRLDSVHFISPTEGWASGGWYEADTQLSRGVLLHTVDGGQSWNRMAVDLPRMRKVHFRSPREGTAVGDWSPIHLGGTFVTYDGGHSWQSAPPSESQSTRDLADTNGPLVTLDDAGRLMHNYDFHAGAAINDQLWTAGMPGDRIFSIGPGGVKACNSGISAPIHSLFFIDAMHGWAACSFGTILHTTDGGQSWQVQRGGPRTAAVLFVAQQAKHLPWTMIASESLEHGYRSLAVVHREPTTQPAATSQRDLTSQREPTTRRESTAQRAAVKQRDPLHFSSDVLAAQSLSRLGGDDILVVDPPRVDDRQQIDRILVANQPAVIVLSEDVTNATRDAWLAAAKDAPSVYRVFFVHPGERGDVVVHPAAILPDAGVVVGQAWADALSVLAPGEVREDVLVADRLLDREPSLQQIDSMLHRLPIGAGGLSRRMPPSGTRSRLASLQPISRHGEWAAQLIDACSVAPDGPEMLRSRLTRLVKSMRPPDRIGFLRRIIYRCHCQGQVELYRESLQLAGQLVGEESLGQWAQLMLAAIDGSQEWNRMPSAAHHQSAAVSVANHSTPKAYGSPFEKGNAIVQVANQSEASMRTIRTTETTDALWRRHPLRLLSQFSRLGEQANPALQADVQRLASAANAGPWAGLAAGEMQRQRQTGVRATAHAIRTVAMPAEFTSARPTLDGRFDEGIWNFTPVHVGSAQVKSLDDEPTRLAMAYDSRYVYLAIANGFPNQKPIAPATQRQRDADLHQARRLRLSLDVDRDLMTSFELEIDPSGRCRDTCNGFPNWQPNWFVKTETVAGQWNAEIAIARTDVYSLPLAPGDVWNVRLQTIQAGDAATVPLMPSPENWTRVEFR